MGNVAANMFELFKWEKTQDQKSWKSGQRFCVKKSTEAFFFRIFPQLHVGGCKSLRKAFGIPIFFDILFWHLVSCIPIVL